MALALAPTKLILIGEHAVVYGYPGLSLPLPLLTTAEVLHHGEPDIHLEANFKLAEEVVDWLHKLLDPLFDIFPNKNNLLVRLHVTAEAGSGMGVSASVAVALIRAFFDYYNKKLDQKTLFDLARQMETVSHGKPSGIDHTTIIENEPLFFKKINGKLSIRKIPKLFNPMIFKHCAILFSGKPIESTKTMVELVKTRHERDENLVNETFENIENLTYALFTSLMISDETLFHETLAYAGDQLTALGVVSPTASRLRKKLETLGVASKISGAGGACAGSGILLCHHEDQNIITDFANRNDIKFWTPWA